MHYLRQGRGFYRSAIALMLPMILQNLVTNCMALADSFMVGALGETELAAVTMANSVFYVLSLIIFGIQSGTGVLVAQYYGKGRLDAINRIMGMGYYVSLGLTALIALLAFFFPMQLMQLVTNNPDLWEPGAEYANDAAQAAEEAERRNEILRAILKLPKKYRLIIHLYYYEDYDTKEIAGILRMNEATVRTRLARGRKILKEVFSDV